MSSKSIFAALSFSAGCLALSGTVQAAPVTFSDSTSFLSAVSVPGASVGTDTFDQFDHGGNLNTTSLNRNAGGIAYTVSSSISTLWAGATSDGFLTTDNMTSVMSISNFSLGITSFGLNVFGSNFDSFPVTGQSMRVLVTDVMNNVFDYLLEGTTLNSYFGFIRLESGQLVAQHGQPDPRLGRHPIQQRANPDDAGADRCCPARGGCDAPPQWSAGYLEKPRPPVVR